MRDTGKDDQKKRIKLDGGQVISNKKNKKNLYPSNRMSLRTYLQYTTSILSNSLTVFSFISSRVFLTLMKRQLRGVEEKIQGR